MECHSFAKKSVMRASVMPLCDAALGIYYPLVLSQEYLMEASGSYFL
jgi:hypothetical protein